MSRYWRLRWRSLWFCFVLMMIHNQNVISFHIWILFWFVFLILELSMKKSRSNKAPITHIVLIVLFTRCTQSTISRERKIINRKNPRFISSHKSDLCDCKILISATNIYDLLRHTVFFSRARQIVTFWKGKHIFEVNIKMTNEKSYALFMSFGYK